MTSIDKTMDALRGDAEHGDQEAARELGRLLCLQPTLDDGDSADDPVPVAIETPRGLLVACLRATGRPVYPVNPMAVARYRDRHSVTGKKSDHGDSVVLANVLRANQRRISIDEIQTQVAEHYRIRKAEMTSARRAREVARPRQVAMYLSKQLTPKSLPDIGRRFGGRDHTTVIHAVRQIEKLRASDAELDADIRLLTRQLEG